MLFWAVNIIVVGFDLQVKYNLRQNLKLKAACCNNNQPYLETQLVY